MFRPRALGIVAIAAIVAAVSPAAAKKDGRTGDLVWTHPQLATLDIQRIAMLPCASFNADLPSEKLVEGMLASALRGSGYRWVSPRTARSMLRRAAPEDSLLKAVREDILQDYRVDSLDARGLCAALRSDAVLSVRIDAWDQVKLEPIQSGKPSTTVVIKAALVDSVGRLLWSISGSETEEGPYQSPDRNPYKAPGGGVGTKSITSTMEPPAFREVLAKLFDRWSGQFPARVEETSGE